MSLARSSLVMFAGTLTSRLLGFVRSPLLLGAVIGINYPAANAFDIANRLPNLIYMIVLGGVVNAVLVPAIVRASEESADEGAAFINKLLTLTAVVLGAATLVLTLAAPAITYLFAATMDPAWFQLTVALAYWCIPQVFFYGLYTVIGQILNAKENFGPYMWAPVVNNVVAILGLAAMLVVYGHASAHNAADITVWDGGRIAMLGATATLGVALQALVLLWPLRKIGIRFRPDFQWRGAGLGRAARTSWWVLLNMFASLLPTVMLSNVAAGATDRALHSGEEVLAVAGNAAYTSAYTVYSLPTSLIVISIVTAMFTRMSKAAAANDLVTLRQDTARTLRIVAVPMFLCTAGIIVLAVPGVRLLAATVSPTEVVAIAKVLVAMSLGLVPLGASMVLTRVYYAFEDTRGNFLIGLPFLAYGVLGYLLCGFLPPAYVVIGIGLVMASANLFGFLAQWWHIGKRLHGIDAKAVGRTYAQLSLVTAAAIALGFVALRAFAPLGTPGSLWMSLMECLVVGAIVTIVFLGAMRVTQMPELHWFMGPLWRRIRRG